MNDVWKKVTASMTGNADMGRVLTGSIVLSALGVISIVPYFYYLVFVVPSAGPRVGHDPLTFLALELVLLSVLLFLSSLIGFSFSRRFELPGFGEVKGLLKALPILVVAGLLLVAASYLIFDRFFVAISPISFPKGIVYLISLPFKGALADETILRLGLVTIGVGLTKNKGAGVVLMSAVASLFTVKYFEFIGIPFGLNYLFITHLLLSFIGNIILGWLFVTRGLAWAMTLKFIIGLKYLFIFWIGT